MRIAILILFDLFVVNILFAQTRYKDSLFEVHKQSNLSYKEVIDFIGRVNGIFLNVYNPIANRMYCKPTMVFVHDDAFITDNAAFVILKTKLLDRIVLPNVCLIILILILNLL
jgi:hypothetical protein